MESIFYYPLTLHQGQASGSVSAPWVSELPPVTTRVAPNPQVVVLVLHEAQPDGMYLWNGTTWRLVMPYTDVAASVIERSTIELFYQMSADYTQLPDNTQLWKNAIQTPGTVVTADMSSVWAAAYTTSSGGGSVTSVNNVGPDGSGNVEIEIADIPGLQQALDNAGSVKTVSNQSPDVNGNIVIKAQDVAAGTANSLINTDGSTTGVIVLRKIASGTGIVASIDGNGNIDIRNTGVLTVNGQTPDGSGNVNVAAGVSSFNTRTGAIVLQASDVSNVGGALLDSPAFTGTPTAPTPDAGDISTNISTTEFVADAIAGLAPADSPNFTGQPTAPTPGLGDDSTNLATTAFVVTALANGVATSVQEYEFVATAGQTSFPVSFPAGAVVDVYQNGDLLMSTDVNLNTVGPVVLNTGAIEDDEVKIKVTTPYSVADMVPVSGGTYAGPVFGVTASPGDDSTQFATTAFVAAAVSAGSVTSFNTRTGAVTLIAADVTGVGGALLASPAFTGVPTAPTATAGTATTQLATTAFVGSAVTTAVAGLAPLASPTFTGTPAAPTASPGTNTTQVATTAFVTAAVSAGAVTSFNTRTGAVTLQTGDLTAVGGALLASPTFTGTPAAPTATAGTSTTQIATTAFVGTAVSTAVTGLAPLASPTFTGVPAVPTAAPGTNTTQAASTAFVAAAVSAGSVTSFNTRTGAVTLQASDVTTVGGALLASPTFTGVPAAPTATAGTSTTQIATTAFVGTAITSATSALAPLASPTFTGTPAVPTAIAGTNTTQAASTAFVHAAVSTLAPLASPSFTGRAQTDAMSVTVIALGSVSGTQTLNLASASEWTMTITGATTFAFTNTLGANETEVVYLRLTNPGAAVITWPAGTQFAAKTAPTFTASGVDLVAVQYDTTTSTYMVFVIGQNIG